MPLPPAITLTALCDLLPEEVPLEENIELDCVNALRADSTFRRCETVRRIGGAAGMQGCLCADACADVRWTTCRERVQQFTEDMLVE